MSQTAITQAFEQWKASQAITGEPVLLDEFVFANVPGLDASKPVDRNETLPPDAQIVHRQAVSRKGVVNENAVVHSVVLGADVGDFSFNWIGLINKASNTLAMIVHAPVQQKLKTKDGQQGNVLTRSFLMEFNGAQTETGINTPAETWQIDFTARMAGMDERLRLENIDIYGAAAFFGDGWLVGKTGNQFYVTAGAGYVAGLRSQLDANQNITVTNKPVKVWIDVCWMGTLTSAWSVQSKIRVAESQADYEQNGVKHYVFALASIDANGNITDLRPKGTLDSQLANSSYLAKSKNLSDLTDAAKARDNLNLGTVATADIVTSLTDTKSNRVPVVGWMGLGAIADQIPGTMYKQDVSRFDYFNPADNIGPFPGEWAGGISFANSGATGWQLVGLSAGNIPRFAMRLRRELNLFSDWFEMYHTGNKPTAGDVGALPYDGTALAAKKLSAARKINGHNFDGTSDITLSGDDIYPDNIFARPGRAVGILAKERNRTYISNNIAGMSDYSQLVGYQVAEWYDDGCFWGAVRGASTTLKGWGVYYNGYIQFYIDLQTGEVSSGRQGVLASQTWSNQRYIQGMRYGAEAITSLPIPGSGQEATYSAPSGCSVTGMTSYSTGNYTSITRIGIRQLQININGTWINVGG